MYYSFIVNLEVDFSNREESCLYVLSYQQRRLIMSHNEIMNTIKLISKVIGLLFITSGVNSSFAKQIQVNTTFTCTTNAECKRKCEALGGRWKSNPGGSTHGTCSLSYHSLSTIKEGVEYEYMVEPLSGKTYLVPEGIEEYQIY